MINDMNEKELVYTLNELDHGYLYLSDRFQLVADDLFTKFELGRDFGAWDFEILTDLVLMIKSHPDYKEWK